ncbi:LCP family protein [Pseudonocardia bannensis]|uniref:LCP family protein n=1 Tax=Pseudonocardia bannensis TaxID=630973 RepID=A0A848DMZ5_9PSEU|nr:LCP family protein [Pseudonocardia bannensis]NMH94068.1 LCP family protein [Pseudonocardia bannensis]
MARVAIPGGPRPGRLHRVARVVVALLSALVLGLTGYGWAQLNGLLSGLTATDVIGRGGDRDGEENILVVGVDSRTDASGRPLPQEVLDRLHAGDSDDGGTTTDTMLLVHVPADGGSAAVISLPRDAYVPIADGWGTHKINSAFTFGRAAAVVRLRSAGATGPVLEIQADAAGARTAIRTVEQLTGVRITHYIALNLVGFHDLSEAVGGVPVCLNAAVRDSLSGAEFPAGPQTVRGARALAFVRQRHGLEHGDLDRVRRQQAFLAGLVRSALSAGTLADPAALRRITEALQGSVTVDQGWDLTAFTGRLARIGAGGVVFTTIPVGSLAVQTPTDGVAVQVDPAKVARFVQRVVADPSAASSPAADAEAATPAAPAGAVPGRPPDGDAGGSPSATPGPARTGGPSATPGPGRPPPSSFSASAPVCVD